MSPEQWCEALHVLERNGVVFHLILGNELLTYPDPVALVENLRDFHGRYAIYTTFPQGSTERLLDKVIAAGVYNLSSGVDTWPGLLTGDTAVDRKSSAALYWLEYCLEHGVPDVHGTVTIHSHNFDKLEPLFDLLTKKKIWTAVSMVEYSVDNKHDFYGGYEQMKNWLIPESERGRFRDEMYRLAAEIRKGRWMMQVTPEYFEEAADREVARTPWHCSQPLLISIEEDGSLRACGYRGGLDEKWSVFDLREGGALTMQRYIELQRARTSQCPGCGGGGGMWSYWWQAENFQKGDLSVGDRVFQVHVPGYEFERTKK